MPRTSSPLRHASLPAAFGALFLIAACRESAPAREPRATSPSNAEEGDRDEDAQGEESIEISKVPDAVRSGAQKYFSDLHQCTASRESEHGASIFEIVGKGEGGRDVSLNVTTGGSVFEVEREIANEALPPDVRAAIGRNFGGATLQKAEAIEVHYYELHLVKDGKRLEARISATGQVMEDEE